MGDYSETVVGKTGKCVVCGADTHDRSVTLNRSTGKVGHKTWRCGNFEACRERRAAGKKRNRPKPGVKKACAECGGFLWHEDGCSRTTRRSPGQ